MIPSKTERRGPPERPRQRELWKKLTEAKSLVKSGRWIPANPQKLQANFDELADTFGIETTLTEDQTTILLSALDEIRADHYCGGRPPDASYEIVVKGHDMWEFRWISKFFGDKEMYLKFCFTKGDENSRKLAMLSIHPNRSL